MIALYFEVSLLQSNIIWLRLGLGLLTCMQLSIMYCFNKSTCSKDTLKQSATK